jgi:AcrR family transcriptional regulator
VRRRHDKAQLLAAAVDTALDTGIGGLTFGAVARRAEVPDRTVVYYFPTKPELVAASSR